MYGWIGWKRGGGPSTKQADGRQSGLSHMRALHVRGMENECIEATLASTRPRGVAVDFYTALSARTAAAWVRGCVVLRSPSFCCSSHPSTVTRYPSLSCSAIASLSCSAIRLFCLTPASAVCRLAERPTYLRLTVHLLNATLYSSIISRAAYAHGAFGGAPFTSLRASTPLRNMLQMKTHSVAGGKHSPRDGNLPSPVEQCAGR